MRLRRAPGVGADHPEVRRGLWVTVDGRFAVFRAMQMDKGVRRRSDWRILPLGMGAGAQALPDMDLLRTLGLVDSEGASIISFPTRRAALQALTEMAYAGNASSAMTSPLSP